MLPRGCSGTGLANAVQFALSFGRRKMAYKFQKPRPLGPPVPKPVLGPTCLVTGVGPYKLFFGNNASGNDGEAAAMDVRAHGLGSCGQCYDRCTCVCQRSAYVDWSPIAAKASHPAALGLYYEYRMNDSSSSFPDSDAGEIAGPTLQRWPHRCSRSKQNIARCGLRTALSHGTYYRDISKR